MARRLAVLFAAELLDPPVGGAERWLLELAGALSPGHDVRAVSLEAAAGADGYWQRKAERRDRLGARVEQLLGNEPFDVVVTQLHAGPAVVRAAAAAGVASVLVIPSYESFCKLAFDAGSRCVPETRCTACSAALALPRSERLALAASREAHERSLREADALVVPSRDLATVCTAWCGRDAHVVAPVTSLPRRVRASRSGPVVAAAQRWSANKGRDIVAAIAAQRSVAVATAAPRFPELLDGSALFLVPSQWQEPFGRVAFEAMAAGVPTLASATGGLAELVPPEQLVRDFTEPRAWLHAIEELLEEPEWNAARERGLSAAQRLLAEHPASRLAALLQSAAARRRARAPLRG